MTRLSPIRTLTQPRRRQGRRAVVISAAMIVAGLGVVTPSIASKLQDGPVETPTQDGPLYVPPPEPPIPPDPDAPLFVPPMEPGVHPAADFGPIVAETRSIDGDVRGLDGSNPGDVAGLDGNNEPPANGS